jgi:pimeloyl-ACP methyl ester carboxylesterase
VLDSLKLVAPILVGHSMGGNELTTVGSQHPDRIAGLVYLDAGADPKDFPASDPAYIALFEKLPPANRLGPPPRFPEAEYAASGGDRDGTRRALKAIGEGTKKRDYSRIRVPVLSMFATFRPADDRAVEEFQSATMVYIKRYEKGLLAAVPGARIVEVPGANHYIFLSHEGDVVREIKAFVGR